MDYKNSEKKGTTAKLEKDIKHKENLLRAFGIELENLSGDSQTILEKMGIIKNHTKLQSLDLSFIEEWSYARRQEDINANYNNFLMHNQIAELQEEIRQTEKEINDYEEVLNNNDIKTEEEMEKTLYVLEKDIANEQKKIKSNSSNVDDNVDDNVDINGLIEKVQQL